jgi:hypothetical protein
MRPRNRASNEAHPSTGFGAVGPAPPNALGSYLFCRVADNRVEIVRVGRRRRDIGALFERE